VPGSMHGRLEIALDKAYIVRRRENRASLDLEGRSA